MMDLMRHVHTLSEVHMFTKCDKLGNLVDAYSLYCNVPKITCVKLWNNVFVILLNKVDYLNVSLPQEM